ncbi:MFS transporter [Pararhodobacter zhoushanensis]|uniref:MFS transporter n=1 Tax=Pararhodobacter zhoushanensis TaxID=2479545 RepID=A0ABT3H029_9RHOB|nr:MFS transporter [Pararhodobacter zhoushanensis]MCW1933161.1 MFS transporter [Pararhodobacter zhoushanensis]
MKLGIMGVAALLVAHVAGMLDLVALPVWVGALRDRFGFSLQQAGALPTLFLLGAVLASVLFAARVNRLSHKLVATLGFAVAAAAFLAASTQTGFGVLAVLHVVAGVAVGSGLSMVHGAIGRSQNPHRLFAMAGICLGIFAVVFLGAVPQLLIAFGGAAMFVCFGALMAVAAVTSLLFFPKTDLVEMPSQLPPLSRPVWFLIFGISLMTFNQAMVFSFVEVIGGVRGFPVESVLAVLIAMGLVNLVFPAPLAIFLEKRVSAYRVVLVGPMVQAALALVVTMVTVLPVWAPSAAVFVAVQIFTHTFAFGLLARIDRTGRAVSATPAMLMIGAALGPFIGGALSQNFGFPALGIAAVVVAAVSCFFFAQSKART